MITGLYAAVSSYALRPWPPLLLRRCSQVYGQGEEVKYHEVGTDAEAGADGRDGEVELAFLPGPQTIRMSGDRESTTRP